MVDHSPSVEALARKIAFWHGQKMIYRNRDGMQTVASSHGYGNWGHSPDRYAEQHWKEYNSAAEMILREMVPKPPAPTTNWMFHLLTRLKP